MQEAAAAGTMRLLRTPRRPLSQRSSALAEHPAHVDDFLPEALRFTAPAPLVDIGANLTHESFARDLPRSEEHTSELQSRPHLACRLLLEKKKGTLTKLTLVSTRATQRHGYRPKARKASKPHARRARMHGQHAASANLGIALPAVALSL